MAERTSALVEMHRTHEDSIANLKDRLQTALSKNAAKALSAHIAQTKKLEQALLKANAGRAAADARLADARASLAVDGDARSAIEARAASAAASAAEAERAAAQATAQAASMREELDEIPGLREELRSAQAAVGRLERQLVDLNAAAVEAARETATSREQAAALQVKLDGARTGAFAPPPHSPQT